MQQSIKKFRTLSRQYFLSGLLVVVPLVITIYVLRGLFLFLDNLAFPILEPYFGYWLPGIGILIVLAVIYLIGILVTNFIGRFVVNKGENLLLRIPIAKSVYTSVKQILSTFSPSEDKRPRTVVLVEYPKAGVWSVAIVNGESVHPESGQTLLNLLIVAAINPTSGFFVLVPKNEVTETGLSVEDAMKWVVSGGIITPKSLGKVAAPKSVDH